MGEHMQGMSFKSDHTVDELLFMGIESVKTGPYQRVEHTGELPL
jgi:hypothetical protein